SWAEYVGGDQVQRFGRRSVHRRRPSRRKRRAPSRRSLTLDVAGIRNVLILTSFDPHWATTCKFSRQIAIRSKRSKRRNYEKKPTERGVLCPRRYKSRPEFADR